MFEVGDAMFIAIPNEGEKPILHPGKILESSAGAFVAEFCGLVEPPCGSEVAAYCEVDGKFYQQKALIRKIEQIEGRLAIEFESSGPQESAEKRNAYRVRLSEPIEAQIGEELSCSIIDVSPEGFAAVTAQALELGSLVNVYIEFESCIVDGQACVQSISALPNNAYRCGFYLPERDGKMRRSMQRIASTLQRKYLRFHSE
jgi:hypothetical protein